MHLVFEDDTLYAELVKHNSKSVNSIARAFHDSAKDIKKTFSGYFHHWCNPAVTDEEHEAMKQESKALFNLVRERIDYENDKMFPLVEKHF